jgi:hypothetical protein
MLIMRRVQGLGLDMTAARALVSAMSAQYGDAAANVAAPPMPPMVPPPGGTIVPTGTSMGTGQCQCMVQQMAMATNADLPTQNLMAQVCAADPAGFQQRVLAAGVTNFSCPDASALTPWYQKPATWVIGGAIVLVGALALKAAL